MQFDLYDGNNNLLFSTKESTTWWQTGFIFGIDFEEDKNIIMRGTIEFKTEEMAREFVKEAGIGIVSGNVVDIYWQVHGKDM